MNKRVLLFIVLLLNAALVFGQDLKGVKICINPGHGGHDPANDRFIPETGYWESEGNITRGLFLRDILQSMGATVIMTRETNNDADDLPLSQIGAIADNNNCQHMHSIHSNATGTANKANYTLMLYQGKTLAPTYAESRTAAQFIGAEIYAAHRTTRSDIFGDADFYGTGQPYLGVFKNLHMPGTLSESSFHDYVPESWRLKSDAYLKHEAWAMAKAFLAYFGKPALTTGIVAGILRDPDQAVNYTTIVAGDIKKPINKAKITIKPTDPSNTMQPRVTYTDSLNNGFYMFDEMAPGSYKVVFEAPGYFSDSSTVTVEASKNAFADKDLASSIMPAVAAITTAPGDSLYPGKQNIVIDFTRSMDAASVESAISFNPQASVTFFWSNDKRLQIYTTSLPYNTNFTLTIAGTAKEKNHGLPFDGNKDGTGGDSFSYTFRTMMQDTWAPVVESVYPSGNLENVELNPVINISFSELLNTAVLSGKIKIKRNADQSDVAGAVKYYALSNGKAAFTFFPTAALQPDETYNVVILAGISDQFGNAISSDATYSFKTGKYNVTTVSIDNFENNLTTNWVSPLQNSPLGVVASSTSIATATAYVNRLTSSSKSMQINYGWDKTATSWFIREYLSTGTPKSVTFPGNGILQAYVFGDGSGNKFRFCVADGTNFAGREVSPWYTVNWAGWRLVSWDMAKDGLGTWDGNTNGNGTLDGQLKFDSFQFTYTPGSPDAGFMCFDDLSAAAKVPVGVERENGTSQLSSYVLGQNYPNPFNPSTTLNYQIPENSFVTLKVFDMLGREIATLVNQQKPAGKYNVEFNAGNIPSGIYIYTLSTENFKETKKMVLLK